MDSFLASRPTVTKLGSSVKNLTGGVFTPMGEKKPVGAPVAAVSGGAVSALETLHQPHAGEAASEKAAHNVRVEVIRENGSVERIIMHCKCGERIELDCLY